MYYRDEFTTWRDVFPLPFLSPSDCAKTSQAHFPTLKEGKMEKDAHGKCLNYLKSMIIVKHINYNIPWRDGTIVLIVTSTCLLPIKTTPDREIVNERIRFCNKDLTKGTDLNYPAKETTTRRTSYF